MIRVTPAGLYCERGGFHIDPVAPVARAIITHPHGDHAVRGSARYLSTPSCAGILQQRMGAMARVDTLPYGESLTMNGVRVSFWPAGHVLGSAQVRLEDRGETWCVSGDYQTTPNATCEPFEPVRCDTFITESTFGRPIFRWPPLDDVMSGLHDWWKANQSAGKASFVYVYSYGKAQRLLSLLNPAIGPIFAHGEIRAINEHYRRAGIALPEDLPAETALTPDLWSRALVVLPPSVRWKPAFPFHGHFEAAFASGWMLLPSEHKRRRMSTGFVLSDHADCEGLLTAVRGTEAKRILVMHGYAQEFASHLCGMGWNATAIQIPGSPTPPTIPDDEPSVETSSCRPNGR
jgi:putative mRNA 3-end processing factor